MPAFLSRIKNSFIILGLSFKMLFKTPKLFIFPLLTTFIVTVIISAAFITVYFIIGVNEFREFLDLISNKTPDQPKAISYVIIFSGMFCLYFISSFIYAFVSTATAHFSFGKFTTNNVSILNSIKHSSKKIWLIIKWALLNSAVGIILQILSKKEDDKGGIGGIATWILVSLAGLTWQLATFFIIPMIAIEDFKLISSIKNSAKLMKKTFGESIVADFAFSLIYTIIIFIFPIGLLMLFASGEHYLAMLLFPKSYLTQPDSVHFIAPVLGLTILAVTFLLSILSTVKIIFKTAVYAYATGNSTGIFPSNLIKSSFKSKTE
jgi:hypothetical protein